MNTYLVWCPELDQDREDGRRVAAQSHQEAAETWADLDDVQSAEYSIVGGRSTPVVHVQGPLPSASVHIFRVHGEPVPSYRAVEEA